MLVRDEGEVLHLYFDSEGLGSIGVGRLIDPKRGGGIPQTNPRSLLYNDIIRVRPEVKTLSPWALPLDPPRLAVIHSMRFQLGSKLDGFKKFLAAAVSHDWPTAVAEMKDSLWAK